MLMNTITGINYRITLPSYRGYIFKIAVPPYLGNNISTSEKELVYVPSIYLIYCYEKQTGDNNFIYTFQGADVK